MENLALHSYQTIFTNGSFCPFASMSTYTWKLNKVEVLRFGLPAGESEDERDAARRRARLAFSEKFQVPLPGGNKDKWRKEQREKMERQKEKQRLLQLQQQQEEGEELRGAGLEGGDEEGGMCVDGLWEEEDEVVLESFSEGKVERLRELFFQYIQTDGNCLASQLPREKTGIVGEGGNGGRGVEER